MYSYPFHISPLFTYNSAPLRLGTITIDTVLWYGTDDIHNPPRLQLSPTFGKDFLFYPIDAL